MNNDDGLFSLEELARFQVKLKQQLSALGPATLIMLITALEALCFAVVAYIEWEIVFRVFEVLSGDNQYWSPELMGLTSVIMIIGFHVLAKTSPHNFSVRFVEKSVQFLIPIYLVGIGLFIACQFFADGLGDILGSDVPVIIGDLPVAAEGSWIDAAFANITNPAAVLAFALGVGGLAVVNIFVAHTLLTMIAANLGDLSVRVSRAKEAAKDHVIILRCHKEYAALGRDVADLEIWDDLYIRLDIAAQVLGVIADALLPHKIWLKEREIDSSPQFGAVETVDPKQVAKDIAKIEAITQAHILKFMTPQLLENSK